MRTAAGEHDHGASPPGAWEARECGHDASQPFRLGRAESKREVEPDAVTQPRRPRKAPGRLRADGGRRELERNKEGAAPGAREAVRERPVGDSRHRTRCAGNAFTPRAQKGRDGQATAGLPHETLSPRVRSRSDQVFGTLPPWAGSYGLVEEYQTNRIATVARMVLPSAYAASAPQPFRRGLVARRKFWGVALIESGVG